MVTVTNGIDTLIITNGSLEVYRTHGFVPVDEYANKNAYPTPVKDFEEQNKVEEVINEEADEAVEEEAIEDFDSISEEDAIFAETIEEKPLSQWSGSEVKKYAAIKDIDISGTRSAKEAKAIIKKYFDALRRKGN